MSEPLLCWNCGTSLEDVPQPISRHANCSNCFEALHCCRLCRHYAPGRPDDCDNDRAEAPTNKETANFCEYFKPCATAFKSKNRAPQSLATEKFDALFHDDMDDVVAEDKNPDTTDQNRSTNPFDDLFND